MAVPTSNAKYLTKKAEVCTKVRRPTCIVVLGMPGSGKTTLVKNIAEKIYKTGQPFIINLDPACEDLPYSPNIDIRDAVDYREIMDEFDMNMNNSIVKTLNFYSTRIVEIIEIIETSDRHHEYIIVDAPGLKEIFLWPACGQKIIQIFGFYFPTVVINLMDSVSCSDPVNFVSNMMYVVPIMQKVQLPFIIALSKIDSVDNNYALKWLEDLEAFRSATNSIDSDEYNILFDWWASIFREFTTDLKVCGISACTDEGIASLFKLLDVTVDEANMKRNTALIDIHK